MNRNLINKNHIALKVSGNIISELSDRIPNHFVALNELIKNSYDADAKLVRIGISSKDQTISVIDDGNGMTEESMEELLHIARSNKEYANRRDNGRITQGEKGLGTLAAFHFGDIVEWETSQNGSTGYKFNINKKEIINYDNIAAYQAIIETVPVAEKGTRVLMHMEDNAEFKFLMDTLKDKKISEKILRALYSSELFHQDPNSIAFKIAISIDDKLLVEDEFDQMEKYHIDRTFRVTYDSAQDSLIKYYYGERFLYEKKFLMNPSLNEFRVKCDLDIYDFGPGSKYKSKDFPGVFKKLQEKDTITPLVYINQSLFNNYTLFDTNLIRSSRSSDSLPQITGEIEIESASDKLKFNSDRTEINENHVTIALKEEINNLNRKIQTIGSKFKDPFIDLNRSREPAVLNSKILVINNNDASDESLKKLIEENIKHDVYAKFITYSVEDNKVKYNFFNVCIEAELNTVIHSGQKDQEKKREEQSKKMLKIAPAKITLTKDKEKLTIPSNQIDLTAFIKSEETLNSYGKPIPLEEIRIRTNEDDYKEHKVLPSVAEEKNLVIYYEYTDNRTGDVSKALEFEFVKEPPIKMGGMVKEEKVLIHTHGIGNFHIRFDGTVAKLVNQLNNLNLKDYMEVTSVCLRPLLEISVNSLKNLQVKSMVIKSLQEELNAINRLGDSVRKILTFIERNRNMTQVSNILAKECTNVSYHTLNNLLDIERMVRSSNQTNLGSHNSTINLNFSNITTIAYDISYFLIIVEAINRGRDSQKWK